jgi:hypothetical protein
MWLGTRDALCQAIMTTLMEQTVGPQRWPGCTREQAAALLEALREQYQTLSRCERGAVKSHLLAEAGVQFSMEGEQ